MAPEPTRAAALRRLADFTPRAGRAYAATRNEDRGTGAHDNVSGLSPYIRHRLVTEAEVLQAVLAAHGVDAARKFVDEVFWRAYFKGHLESRPTLWSAWQRQLRADGARVAADATLRAQLDAAQSGITGIDCFDDWARELVATGYLHNHARMWFASIWIFTLQLPWALGAEFTLRHFIDGDPASNTLSWRWVAGLHTRGKHYLARADNIERFTGGRYAPRGLAESAPPLAEDGVAPMQPLPVPLPLPASGPIALLLTEEDLAAASLDLPAGRVTAVAAPARPVPRTTSPAGVVAEAFVAGALADGLASAAAHFGCAATTLPELDGDAIADWVATTGARVVVTPYAPVGAVRARLDDARAWLLARGITLAELRRPWDARAWPYCGRGFFDLRAKIDALLAQQGLGPAPASRQGQLGL